MENKQGSVLGCILLIGGSTIGAGMLGLPILTGLAGFFPALVTFLAAWAFMTITALLIVEINGWFTNKVNYVSMAGHSFGQVGRGLAWILYLLLFYSLLVAYTSGSGNLTSGFLNSAFSWEIPIWICSLFFVLLFGWLIYRGTRPVDLWNRVLMVGKILAFIGIVAFGVRLINPELLLRAQPSQMLAALPVLVISFGFHNMIPTIVTYLGGDLKRVRKAILGGSLFVLFVYLIWEIVVLGIVPLEGPSGIVESLQNDQEASQSLAGVLGSSWVSTCAGAMAFFAILTSFLAQGLGLIHFLADGLKVQTKQRENIALCAFTLGPPVVLSIIYPQLFFKALNFAGGICAVLLFGIMPAAMVWIGRYKKSLSVSYRVAGGKPLLAGIILFSLLILFFQIGSML
jgi:tyrosine-specific transport protein